LLVSVNRYHLFDKAFRLAIDLQCRDLFLDIHFSARQAGQMDLATAAYNKAEEMSEGEDSASSHSGMELTKRSHFKHTVYSFHLN